MAILYGFDRQMLSAEFLLILFLITYRNVLTCKVWDSNVQLNVVIAVPRDRFGQFD